MIGKTLEQNSPQKVFELQSSHQWTVRRSSSSERIKKLKRLKASIQSHEVEVKSALHSDLRQVELAESAIAGCYGDIDDAIENLEGWMAPVDVQSSGAVPGTRAKIIYEARGIILLFSAWNFPFNLIFQPLVPIIAAGNCAIVKPNSMAPKTSAIAVKIIREAFNEKEIAVFEGSVELSNQLLAMPIDHIFFTGSPAVGKIILSAAAKHLATVTLELGGKNPVIIDKQADIQDAATKIAMFRNMNNGQVCLCPENVWVHANCKDQFIEATKTAYEQLLYTEGELNIESAGKIVNQRNLDRIKGYVEDATQKGAKIAYGGEILNETQSMHPTVLVDVPADADINFEEVFGPILSVFTYNDISEVYAELNKQSKPLSLYIFSTNDAFVSDVLINTSSGGVTVNNCMLHFMEHNLPFGGVGGSGTGRYHSVHGFKELSHERSVLYTDV
ncbi:aldehyde dehydrogenase family protein [Dasania marina]|uniref:aldehyde dehydrogenase family protein n=1 Tax=Dasania marina TaxID=471499 RepID=UPI0030D992C1|tara:strand:+ start:18568 stop:19902 length:1335 start_codon:yes stop_codon:yes gene_type:complete